MYCLQEYILNVFIVINYYQILGVPTNAQSETIKKRFRILAFKHHPDRNDGNLASLKKFKQIKTAYDVLIDPQKRMQYDYSIANYKLMSSNNEEASLLNKSSDLLQYVAVLSKGSVDRAGLLLYVQYLLDEQQLNVFKEIKNEKQYVENIVRVFHVLPYSYLNVLKSKLTYINCKNKYVLLILDEFLINERKRYHKRTLFISTWVLLSVLIVVFIYYLGKF